MRDALRLTREDLRRATSNVMAAIVLFGLVVIPSLFTWFNVIASWDPFANTTNLKVAVASSDEGYQSALVPIRINVGEQVLSTLRANDELDWIITSPEDAIDGTESGAYYAAIVLPASFSADMMTFYADGAQRTSVAYYTNEKKNALAPKITGQGAEQLSTQISRTFTEVLSDVALGLVSSLSDHLTDEETQAVLARLEGSVGGLAAQMRAGAHTADLFNALLGSSVTLVDSASSLVDASRTAADDASGAIAGGAQAATSLGLTLETAARSLSEALEATAGGYAAVRTSVDALLDQADAATGDQADVLRTLAARVQQQIDAFTTVRGRLADEIAPQLPEAAQPAVTTVLGRLDDAIARQQNVHDRLVAAADALDAGTTSAQDARADIAAALDAATAAINDAQDAFDNRLGPQLDALADTLADLRSDVAAIKSSLAGATSGLSGASDSIRATLRRGQDTTGELAASLNEAADTFDRLQAALATAGDTGDLSALSEVIGSDPGVLATSLAEPVRVDRTAVFAVATFGASMAPLYLILSLWVGALLMTVVIPTEVRPDALPDRPQLSPAQKYLGRYGIYAVAGLAQSTLVTTGLILFVQIEPQHPFLLVLTGWITSLVFTLLIYTGVAAFGNAGKALAVLLLVIQISGAGGAYPLELLPSWFQTVSPFLPATHAVNAARASIAGVYQGDLWISLSLLLAFVAPALLLGLVLRRPLITFNRRLSEALESTHLM